MTLDCLFPSNQVTHPGNEVGDIDVILPQLHK